MTSTAPITEETREQIIAQPEVILDDHEMMRALIAANERTMGANIVDLRGIAMERLESRLDRLEETHRSVIAAAYENLAGMNLIHRAVLRMLDAGDFERFMADLGGEDPHQFRPGQGTDLLGFFGGVFERAMRRWLA